MADKELAQLQVIEMKTKGVLTSMVGSLEKELKGINNLNFQSKKQKLKAHIGVYLDYLDLLKRSLAPYSPIASLIKAQVMVSELVNIENIEAEKRRWDAVIIKINNLKAANIDSFVLEMDNLLEDLKREITFFESTLIHAIAARKVA